jgi:uncharacterized membrane protein
MEIVLLILIIVLLIYQNGIIKDKLNNIYNKVWELESKLHKIQGVKKETSVMEFEETKSSNIPLVQTETIAPQVKEEEAEERVFSTFETIRSFEISNLEEEKESLLAEPISQINSEENIEDTYDANRQVIEETKAEKESAYQSFVDRNPDIERFIGENLISKIGIAILVLGIAFFVQFAIDNNWIGETARAGVGLLAGGIVLGFAHRLHANYKAFSSVLVAGGISIFYFTLAIAFQDYHLFSQTVAFVLMSLVTCFSVYISLAYDRQELAVLSLIGGFASPLMVSTGSGNYQVLFTYLILLDLGILVLAYFRNWNLLNILTFVFTALTFGAWLSQKVFNVELDPPYAGALVFASAFYLIFTLSNLVNQIKEKRPFEAIELGLILSNTFLYFSVGIAVLTKLNDAYLGLFTIGLALFNLAVTYFVHRNYKVDTNLFYLLIGLTLTFVTLAAPIQLKGNYITLFWAAEASLLIWLAQKSKLQVYRFVSILIASLSIISLMMDWTKLYATENELRPILNEAYLSGLFVLASFIFYKNRLKLDGEESFDFYGIAWTNKKVLNGSSIVIILLTYVTGYLELSDIVRNLFSLDYQVGAIMFCYHLFFSSILILVLKKYKVSQEYYVVQFLGLLNLIIYVLLFAMLSQNEIKWQMENGGGVSLAYYIHLLSLVPFIHQMSLLYQVNRNRRAELAAWLLTICVTLLASTELVWTRLQFSLTELCLPHENYEGYYLLDKINESMVKGGLPVLWGCLAFVFLIFGIRRRVKPLRIAALSLIGITILKLFVYDIRNVSKGGKIGAFIILGIVLLVISFTYQKIKSIILDEETSEVK